MIEFLGLLYHVGTDIYSYIKKKTDVENKPVTMKWFEASGFKEEFESKGYNLRWITPKKLEEWKLKGYEEIYVQDENDKSKVHRLVINNSNSQVDLILTGKKKE